MKRPMALRFNSMFDLTEELKHYEISVVDPLHDICGHIKNLYTELLFHIEDEGQKKYFKQPCTGSFDNKSVKRG